MTALFESGSSHLHFAWWDGEKISDYKSLEYPENGLFDEEIITCLVGEINPDLIAACSVRSKWREKLFQTLNALYKGKLAIARTASDIGIVTPYSKPETYGIDRALAVLGAFSLFGNACVVIDIGTAVTVDAVDKKGNVIGGYIFPGSEMMSSVIAEKTDLPFLHAQCHDTCLGTDTDSALKYGIGKGFLAAVDVFMLSAAERAGAADRIVLTGGGAESIAGLLSIPVICRPHLVIETLGKVAKKLPLYA